ncbi:adenylate/guanylate cyclase domain-containing protein [uncultured Psychrobacter sp.]|uniref:adenylate/guanylate cyclase domain-containing protein n=1 Tax=uncultured Psychrobacter sp. TaxID=259303 RepID=UPI0032B120D5
MSISEMLKPKFSLKTGEGFNFNYPEVYVLLLSVALLALYYEFSPTAMALFVIISLPSLMILVYNYRRPSNFWTSNAVVVLLGTVIGTMQFCVVIALSLAVLIAVRIIISEAENRAKLLMAAIITMVIFYYVSITLSGSKIDCDKGFVAPTTLFASLLVVLGHFWFFYNKYIEHSRTAAQSKGRLSTMVSVISKLTRFVPQQIWQPIVKSNSEVQVANKRAKLSIMFSDIVGFTELSDSLSADNLADILNTYMEVMTDIANKHGAVLDKFIGDGMVCFFGEPNSRGVRQDALDCVAMAIDMRREMRSLRQKWRLMGFDGLYVRIGITTGYCHVGNFGSSSRLNYTIIGREANRAARLEQAAGNDEILISQATYDYICHDYQCKYAISYKLKGFDDVIRAWQVLDPDADKDESSKWVDHTLPGFNLHLNFKDMKNYDYQEIRNRLNFALERIEKEENDQMSGR